MIFNTDFVDYDLIQFKKIFLLEELAEKYDIVEAALGLYPTDALELSDKEIDDELDFIRKNKRISK